LQEFRNMKRLILCLVFAMPIILAGQRSLIIDHNSIELNQIPMEWIDSAIANLHIGYGHTSHGSQLTSGMNALESYYPDGTYDWSQNGGPGELHLFEGSGYSSGYLELDCGYEGWDDETREYLDDFPDCNVIIWSWCGQVNDVDLSTHYLGPMEQLETEYPDVRFVYMTGHLEGLGTGGSLFQANQQIRDYCIANNKILFDFADIEKYDPDAEVNYQDYFADDGCYYIPPGGGTANWAYDWLDANPAHELTQISQLCSSCAHSVSLNCVKKGIACWHLWTMLAGWEGPAAIVEPLDGNRKCNIKIFPVPASDQLTIVFSESVHCDKIEIIDLRGVKLYSRIIMQECRETNFANIKIPPGIYLLRIVANESVFTKKISIVR